jgi:hypothetical protein
MLIRKKRDKICSIVRDICDHDSISTENVPVKIMGRYLNSATNRKQLNDRNTAVRGSHFVKWYSEFCTICRPVM